MRVRRKSEVEQILRHFQFLQFIPPMSPQFSPHLCPYKVRRLLYLSMNYIQSTISPLWYAVTAFSSTDKQIFASGASTMGRGMSWTLDWFWYYMKSSQSKYGRYVLSNPCDARYALCSSTHWPLFLYTGFGNGKSWTRMSLCQRGLYPQWW